LHINFTNYRELLKQKDTVVIAGLTRNLKQWNSIHINWLLCKIEVMFI